MLQRIDDWIAEGVLGGEQLNAADLQIAASTRLAMTLDDLRPAIEARPAGEHAVRVVPEYPGQVPPVLPAAWLESLRAPVPAPPQRALRRARLADRRRALPATSSRRAAVGQRQLGIQLQQRRQHEAAAGDLGVRKAEALGLQLEVPEQEDVDVDRPRPVAGAAGYAPEVDLDRLARRRAAPRGRGPC